MGEQSLSPKDNLENGMDHDHQDSDNSGGDSESEDTEYMSPEEYHALNSRIDDLNAVLDNIERKNDDIYSELLELLRANREMRQQMQGSDEESKPSA